MAYPNSSSYELTENAQEAARNLVEDWDKFGQPFQLIDGSAGSDTHIEFIRGRGVPDDVRIPPLNSLIELENCKLISMREIIKDRSRKWEITLLPALKNAVNDNFVKRNDSSLTFNSIGTFVSGNLNNYGQFQSIGSNEVHIQTFPEFMTKLIEILGEDLLNREQDLKQAVSDLNGVEPSNRIQKLGNLLSILANLKTVGEIIPKVVSVIDVVGKVMQNRGII